MRDSILDHPVPIFFEEVEQFTARKNYSPAVHCAPENLSHLVGKYHFPKAKWIPCGLNGCTRQHGRGFVFATKDGKEGHCGRDCGQNHLGFAFDKVLAVYQAAEKAHSEQKRLLEWKADIEHAKAEHARISGLAEIGVRRVRHLLKNYIEKTPEISREFWIAARNNGRIQAESPRESRRLFG